MGLFSRKKEKIEQNDVPPAPTEMEEKDVQDEDLELPEFPEIPEEYKDSTKKEELRPADVVEETKEMLEPEVPSKPIFIDVNEFKEVLEEISMIKTILKEADDAGARTEEFAVDEDKEFKKWKNLTSDIQKSLIYCEKTLFR